MWKLYLIPIYVKIMFKSNLCVNNCISITDNGWCYTSRCRRHSVKDSRGDLGTSLPRGVWWNGPGINTFFILFLFCIQSQ